MVSAAPPGAGTPWLLGGGIIGADAVNHVAIWSATSLAGPWRADGLEAVPGRDGPNETILGFAAPGGTSGGPEVAFGSRPSPTEGYPRPSTWSLSNPVGNPRWQEALADRELFGGPNVIGLGGLAGGPHGYFIAGTWIGPANRVVADVWTSENGSLWTRDDTDPSFSAGASTESYAYDVADGPAGVILAGTTAAPTPGAPTRQIGSVWYSADGRRWVRLAALPGADPTVANVVRVLGSGWLAAGRGGPAPVVWTIDAQRRVSATSLPMPPGGSAASVDDLAVTPAAVLAVGVTGDGHPIVWTTARHGDQLKRWRLVTPPAAAGSGWSQARVAATGSQVVLVAFNDTRSEVWRADRGG